MSQFECNNNNNKLDLYSAMLSVNLHRAMGFNGSRFQHLKWVPIIGGPAPLAAKLENFFILGRAAGGVGFRASLYDDFAGKPLR